MEMSLLAVTAIPIPAAGELTDEPTEHQSASLHIRDICVTVHDREVLKMLPRMSMTGRYWRSLVHQGPENQH